MRKWVAAVAVAAVMILGWRGFTDAREWQTCGATSGDAVTYAVSRGKPSTLECLSVALTAPTTPQDTPQPTEPAAPTEPPAVVCGDPGESAYAFTTDDNGCEIEEAERADPGDLPGPLPAPYNEARKVGCSTAIDGCQYVYAPDVPDDGVCAAFTWDGGRWVRVEDPAAYLCPNHHGA